LKHSLTPNKDLLKQNLGAYIVKLKRVRPDLCYMAEAEQKDQLLAAIMKGLFTLADSFKYQGEECEKCESKSNL